MTTPVTALAYSFPDGEAMPCALTVADGCATARVENPTGRDCRVVVEFSCVVQARRAVLPLTMNGLFHHDSLTSVSEREQLAEADQPMRELVAHYLEPAGSHPDEQRTAAPLLIPLVESLPDRHAFFASAERPWRIASQRTADGRWRWSLQTIATIAAGQSWEERCWLLAIGGAPGEAWRAFHRLAMPSQPAVPGWLREVRAHYFDFLSAGADGRRGGGFDESARCFREFRVGLATQHGYYPFWGDYIQPGRTGWSAMCSDARGPATMSLDRIRQRIAAARHAGARAGIYMHLVGFDGASPLDAELRDAARVGADGMPEKFGWSGPDVIGPVRFMSLNAPAWRKHLLQQAAWIMELLDPDAIVVDETFSGVGYDHHPDRSGPTGLAAIQWMKDLRALVHSYGAEKAVLSSDCTLGSLGLWADGEAGDHAYADLLGHPLYRQEPVRYLSVLNGKPWLPCAWNAWRFWREQVDLARRCGAAVGVSDGWLEFTGLARLAPAQRQQMLEDLL